MAAMEPDDDEFIPLVEAEGKTSFTARVDPRTNAVRAAVRLSVDPGASTSSTASRVSRSGRRAP